MRTEKTIRNVSSNVFIFMLKAIMLFIVRIVFIRKLGEIYLGIDSLFTNILTAFSIAELGLSSAISFSLYKPLANHDTLKINSLMSYYKKMYQKWGIIILICGIFISLFLKRIVNYQVEYLYLIFYLYLLNTVLTYFISYKEILIIADQNNYKLTKINFVFYMLLYLLRIISLLLINNFLVYVLILVIINLIQKCFINRYVTKYYKDIDFNSKRKIDEADKKSISDNIKSMFMHKTGSYIINGTDNIIISSSKTLGIGYVGIYTNYLSITSMVNTIFLGVYKGITSSFGNLAVLENKNTQNNVFNIINFAGFLMYGFVAICFCFLLSDFIELCFGNHFRLDNLVVIIMCLNFYFNGMISSIDLIKDATGVYQVDRFAPLIQAVINLLFSILLVNKLGVLGVVLGTLISIILVPLWNKPYIVYKYVFKSALKNYMKNQIKYFLFLVFNFLILFLIFKNMMFSNLFFSIFSKLLLIILVYIITMYIVFHKNKNFNYFRDLFVKLLKKLT